MSPLDRAGRPSEAETFSWTQGCRLVRGRTKLVRAFYSHRCAIPTCDHGRNAKVRGARRCARHSTGRDVRARGTVRGARRCALHPTVVLGKQPLSGGGAAEVARLGAAGPFCRDTANRDGPQPNRIFPYSLHGLLSCCNGPTGFRSTVAFGQRGIGTVEVHLDGQTPSASAGRDAPSLAAGGGENSILTPHPPFPA